MVVAENKCCPAEAQKTCYGRINNLDVDEDHIILVALFGVGGIEDVDE